MYQTQISEMHLKYKSHAPSRPHSTTLEISYSKEEEKKHLINVILGSF